MADPQDQPYVDDDAKAALLSSIVAPLRAQGIDPDNPTNSRYDSSGRPQLQVRPEVAARNAAEQTAASVPPPMSRQGTGIGVPYRSMGANDSTAAPTPAAVTPSGNTTSNVYDRAQAGAMTAADESLKRFRSMPDAQAELAREQQLAEQQQADQARAGQLQSMGNLRGKELPQEYRPSVGQRILRGIGAVQHGGVLAIPTAPYGAPNREWQADEQQATGRVAADTASLAEQRQRFKEAHDAAIGSAREGTEVSGAFKNIAAEDAAKTRADADALKAQAADDKANQVKSPTNYEQTVIAAQSEKDPNGPLHSAAKEMRDTEVRKFKAGNSGRAPTELELWQQAFKTQYNRAPNADEIAARKSLAQSDLGLNKPPHAKDRQTFEDHWNAQFKPVEAKYDAQRKSVSKDDTLSDQEKTGEYNRIETERAGDKARLQAEKDSEAQQYGVYNQQPAVAPRAAAPAPPTAAPVAQTPKYKPGAVAGPAPKGATEGRTGKLADGTPVKVVKGQLVVQQRAQ